MVGLGSVMTSKWGAVLAGTMYVRPESANCCTVSMGVSYLIGMRVDSSVLL